MWESRCHRAPPSPPHQNSKRQNHLYFDDPRPPSAFSKNSGNRDIREQRQIQDFRGIQESGTFWKNGRFKMFKEFFRNVMANFCSEFRCLVVGMSAPTQSLVELVMPKVWSEFLCLPLGWNLCEWARAGFSEHSPRLGHICSPMKATSVIMQRPQLQSS